MGSGIKRIENLADHKRYTQITYQNCEIKVAQSWEDFFWLRKPNLPGESNSQVAFESWTEF